MKSGDSKQTVSTDAALKEGLVKWKNDDKYSYWRPFSHYFRTIDSIVKLKQGGVAYLQMTFSDKHPVNVAFLKTLNRILGEVKPMPIVVCPTLAAAEKFAFTIRKDVLEASNVCSVYAAYCGEAGIDPKMDGPHSNVDVSLPPPPDPQPPKKQKTEAK